jgi:hypothetical protein
MNSRFGRQLTRMCTDYRFNESFRASPITPLLLVDVIDSDLSSLDGSVSTKSDELTCSDDSFNDPDVQTGFFPHSAVMRQILWISVLLLQY